MVIKVGDKWCKATTTWKFWWNFLAKSLFFSRYPSFSPFERPDAYKCYIFSESYGSRETREIKISTSKFDLEARGILSSLWTQTGPWSDTASYVWVFVCVNICMCKCVYFCATKQADVQMHRPLWLGSQLSAPVFALWGADNCEQMFTIQYQPQLRANVHNSIAATIMRECPRFGIKSGTLGGLWLWSYYWILWKGKMLLIKERRFYWWLKQCGAFFWPPHCNDENFFHQIEWSRKKASRVNGKTNLWSG